MPVVKSSQLHFEGPRLDLSGDEGLIGKVEARIQEMRKNESIMFIAHSLEKKMSKNPPIKGPPILLKFKDIINAEFALK
jgi:hypothetical protein